MNIRKLKLEYERAGSKQYYVQDEIFNDLYAYAEWLEEQIDIKYSEGYIARGKETKLYLENMSSLFSQLMEDDSNPKIIPKITKCLARHLNEFERIKANYNHKISRK